MAERYAYESFKSVASDFDKHFTEYLNKKVSENWKVKHCDFIMAGSDKTASCLFKRSK